MHFDVLIDEDRYFVDVWHSEFPLGFTACSWHGCVTVRCEIYCYCNASSLDLSLRPEKHPKLSCHVFYEFLMHRNLQRHGDSFLRKRQQDDIFRSLGV